MKKTTLYFLLILSILCIMLIVIGCGGGNNGGVNEQELTPQQLAQIEQTSQEITRKLTNAAVPGSDAALREAKSFAEAQSNVEIAVIEDGGLLVQYRNAGQEIWPKAAPLPTPPADLSELRAYTRSIIQESLPTRASVGTRRAVELLSKGV